jgi:Rieske Fe-S protein
VVTRGPAPRPLDVFPIEIVDGEVVVDTGNPIERQAFDPSQATEV